MGEPPQPLKITSQRRSSSTEGEPSSPKPFLSFSIENILGSGLRNACKTTELDSMTSRGKEIATSCDGSARGAAGETDSPTNLPWLAYTRYSPPKLPRARRRKATKRRCSGNPRVPFSTSQLMTLERKYVETRYLSGPEVSDLAATLRLSEHRVKIWFQNRRAREKKAQGFPDQAGDPHVSFSPRAVLDRGRCFLPGWFNATV